MFRKVSFIVFVPVELEGFPHFEIVYIKRTYTSRLGSRRNLLTYLRLIGRGDSIFSLVQRANEALLSRTDRG